MEYNDIDPAIRAIITDLSEDEFNALPPQIREFTYQGYRNRWLAMGSPRTDALLHPMEEAYTHKYMTMDELTEYYYEDHVRNSTMGIVEHRFTLRTSINKPTPWEYISMVSHQARLLEATNVTLEYVSSDDVIYHLNLSNNNIMNQSIEELLNMLRLGSSEWEDDFYGASGSDHLRNAIPSYSLSVYHFTIIVCHISGGYGKMIPDYYQTLGLENNGDDCLIQCFIYINHLHNLTRSPPETDMIRKQLLKEGRLGIDAIPLLEQLFDVKVDVLRDYRYLEFETRRNTGQNISLIDSIHTVITKDEPVIVYGSGGNKWQLLYKDNHFDVITITFEASKCHCPHTGNFIGYGQSYSKKQLVRELKKKFLADGENLTQYDGSEDEDDKDIYYYFFDYETVFDPVTMEIIPYAYAIVKCDSQFNIMDTRYHIGMGCDKNLSDYLFKETPTQDEKKYLIGYNNSRFDNFILLRHALRNNDYVGYTRFAGNSIVSATVNKFIIRDLCRILNMPLDKACKNFKIKMPKLTNAIKHHEIQMHYIDGTLNKYMVDMHDTIRRYVVRDCECLSELYKVTRDAMHNLVRLDMENHYTLPGMSYAAFKKIVDHKELPVLNKHHERHDHFVRKAIIGGRSQMRCTKRTQSDLYAIDCVSLYPYVMMNREYPIGMPIDTNHYVDNKIGVYHVTIHSQQKHKLNIIPQRDEKTRRLNWAYKDEFKCILSSVDIECLKRHGGDVDIHDGIYWEKTTNKLFDQYFKPLIAEKMKQDAMEGTPDYNAAIRETTKLLMTSLSGKLAQRLYTTETKMMRNASDIDRFYSSTIAGTQTFVRFGSAYIAKGKKNAFATTPCVYGVLIYAYAREHMYESVLQHLLPEELYGMDTDSAFITRDCLQRIHPALIGPEFGQFKIEAQNCDGIFIAPKCYMFFINRYKIINENDEHITVQHDKHVSKFKKEKISIVDNRIIIKARFKGVSMNKDVDMHDELVDMILDSDGKVRSGMDSIRMYREYHSAHNSRVGLHTYKKLLKERECHVLCCNIEKTIIAPKQNTAMYMCNHVFVKKITIADGDIDIKCVDEDKIVVV